MTPSLPRPGDVVCGYTISAELGRGGMGAVYKAADAEGRPVAVKVMLDPAGNERRRARFRREAKALMALGHPGVVKLLAADTEGETPCMILEFVPGHDLAAVFASEGEAIDVARRLELMEAVCLAVHHAHTQGILHRDLKPANILITGEGRPKVTDFGLARDASRHTRLTQTGAFLGTPAYMSPEQVRGEKDTAPTSDVFSLGVILYEALCGVTPFAGPSPIQLITEIVDKTPAPPSTLNPQLGPEHDAVCARALAKAPADRYPSAQALAEAIAALRRSGGGSFRARRLGRGAAAFAAALVCAAAAALWSTAGPGPLDPQELVRRSRSLAEDAQACLRSDQPLSKAGERVQALEARLSVLQRRSGGNGMLLERARDRVQTLRGLLALARGETASASATLASLDGDAPELRALRGGVAALTSGDAVAAAADLSAALARGMDQPELHAWRVAAQSRAGFPGRFEATRCLGDLDAIAKVRPLSAQELTARVRALLAAERLDDAEAALGALPAADTALRWEVALEHVARRRPFDAESLRRIETLPGPTPQTPQTAALAQEAYAAAARDLAHSPRDLPREETERILATCRLAHGLDPATPLPEPIRTDLLARAVDPRRVGGDTGIAFALQELAPDDLSVQRQVGTLSQRVSDNADKRRCVVALRRAIALAPSPIERSELERVLCTSLAFINARFRYRSFELGECQEIVRVASLLLEREDQSPAHRAEAFGARAVARWRLGELAAGFDDATAAIDHYGSQPLYHYARMLLAQELGREADALEEALVYLLEGVAQSEKKNNAALIVWGATLRPGADLERALPALKAFLLGAPSYAGWWARLAHVQLRLGDVAGARASLTRAREGYEAPRRRFTEYADQPEDLRTIQGLEGQAADQGVNLIGPLGEWLKTLDVKSLANTSRPGLP